MSKLKALILIAAGFCSAAFAQQASVPLTKADVDVWLDGYLPYALRSGDIPGAVVTIVKDGQILTARGFGYADVEKRTPVDPQRTLFRPGSVSKLITWTAAIQLVEQGKLDLDRDVNTYLDFRIPDYDGKGVTLRQLMTHTAGFEETAKDIIHFDPGHQPSLGDYVKRRLPQRVYAPGSTPAYSNWATALTGYLIERVSGEPFDQYVERHIFTPLGMANATFRQPLPSALAAQMSSGYRPGKDAGKFEIVGPGPAGALSASGTDMAQFMIAHLEKGRGILSPEAAAMMQRSSLEKISPLSLLPPLNRMELGFFETNVNGHEVIGHLGDTEFFHSSLHLFSDDAVGIYFSFNSPGKANSVQALRSALFQDFADRYFPASRVAGAPVDAKTAAEHVRMMAGNWQNSRTSWSNPLNALQLLSQTKVSVGPKGGLFIPDLKGANGQPREWIETAPFVWHERDGHERIAARVENGRVARWSFDLIAPFMVFDRVPASRSATWIIPASSISLAILLLTVLFWPIAWFTRRRFHAALAIGGNALRAYRATRLVSTVVLLVLIGWAITISVMFADIENLSGTLDGVLWLLQIVGAIAFIGAVVIAGWNAWLTWRDGRRWPARVWNTLVFVAALVLLYVAFMFRLLSMTTQY